MSKSTHDQLDDAEQRIAILENALGSIADDIKRRTDGKDARTADVLLRDIANLATDAVASSQAVLEATPA